MSFSIASSSGARPRLDIDLPAAVNMTIPSTSWGVIPHDDIVLSVDPGYLLWILRTPRAALDLLVDTYCLTSVGPDYPLVTRVFNLSAKPVRIKAGTVLSRLVSVRLE